MKKPVYVVQCCVLQVDLRYNVTQNGGELVLNHNATLFKYQANIDLFSFQFEDE